MVETREALMKVARSSPWKGLLVMLWMAAAPVLDADPTAAEIVDLGKRAIVVVDVRKGTGVVSGSAFCVQTNGVFVTSGRLISSLGADARVILLPDSARDEQAGLEARVVRCDKDADLAILQVDTKSPFSALTLGQDEGVADKMAVRIVGYPTARFLRPADEKHAVVTASGTKISALRKREGKLEALQLDTRLAAVQSGCPVLDAKGRVIGMVAGGIRGAALDSAVPVGRVREILDRVEVVFRPAPVPHAQREKEREFSIEVLNFSTPPPAYTVRLVLDPTALTPRVFEAKAAGDHVFTASAIPVPPRTGPEEFRVRAQFPDGPVTALVTNRPFKVGAREIQISEVRTMDLEAQATSVVLANGEKLTGTIVGLDSIEATVGGLSNKIALAKASSVRIENAYKETTRVECKVVARLGDETMAETTGFISIQREGAPPAASGPADVPETDDGRVVIKLPGEMESVVQAGRGRYLLGRLGKPSQLAIVDLGAGRVVKYLPLPEGECLIAGGATRFVVVLPEKNIIQRWSLDSLEIEASVISPLRGRIHAIAMGYDSDDRLFACDEGGLAVFDPIRMRRVDLERSSRRDITPPLHLRASPDGSTVGSWGTGAFSPTGLGVLVVRGKSATSAYEHTSPGYILPSPDGRRIYTGERVYDSRLNPLKTDVPQQVHLIPACSNEYCLGIWLAPPQKTLRAGIYSVADRRLLVETPDLEELSDVIAARSPHLLGERGTIPYFARYYFLPNDGLLATIPLPSDRIVIRKFDLKEALDQKGVDYLFVSSPPPQVAERGARLRYQMIVESRKGGVRLTLQSGPQGMTLSPSGKLEWKVPDQFEAATANVVITVTDSSGQEMSHEFTLRIR